MIKIIAFDLKRLISEKKFTIPILMAIAINILAFTYMCVDGIENNSVTTDSEEYINNNYINDSIKKIQNNNENISELTNEKKLVNKLFSPPGTYDDNIIYDLKAPVDIFKKRIEYTRFILDKKKVDKVNQKKVLQKMNSLDNSIKKSNYSSWKLLLILIGIVTITTALSLIINISNFLSEENETGMKSIINSEIKKINVFVKSLEILVYSSLVFIVNITILIIPIFFLMGIDGWNTDIHLYSELFTSMYNYNFLKCFIVLVIMHFTFIIFVGEGTLFMSLIIKDNITVIFIALFILTFPVLFIRIVEINSSGIISKIFSDFSIINYIIPITPLIEFKLYKMINNIYITKIEMLIITNIMSTIFILFLMYIFKINKNNYIKNDCVSK
ncbi:hypothetical protein [Peptostreptococcus faecalis]|uniref:hypothetical protein n=1 Tax=Peptostreptococcus faecalis TaxID=2045015 RepID=UPI000C7A0497|nr:hypothetical protein [Peptostreptococcus faecalis]